MNIGFQHYLRKGYFCKMEAPIFTVITPVRNRTEWLGRALDSVKCQGVPCEHLLIGDGSTEDVRKHLAFMAQSAGVSHIHLPGQVGVGKARNRGVELAKGSHVLFLDDDDELMPGYLQKALAAMKVNPNRDIFVFRTVSLCSDLRQLRRYEASQDRMFAQDFEHWATLLVHAPGIHSVVFNKAVFDTVRFTGLAYGEDRALLLKLRQRGYHFQMVDFTGGLYRMQHRPASYSARDKVRFAEWLFQEGLLRSRREVSWGRLLLGSFLLQDHHYASGLVNLGRSFRCPGLILSQLSQRVGLK